MRRGSCSFRTLLSNLATMQMGRELSKHNSTKKTSLGEGRSLNHRESHEGLRSGLNIPRRQSGEGGTGERGPWGNKATVLQWQCLGLGGDTGAQEG